MNAQNLRQRQRKRVEKIGGNSGGHSADKFWNSSQNISRRESYGAQQERNGFFFIFPCIKEELSFQQVKKYASILFLFIYFYWRARRDSAALTRRAFSRFIARRSYWNDCDEWFIVWTVKSTRKCINSTIIFNFIRIWMIDIIDCYRNLVFHLIKKVFVEKKNCILLNLQYYRVTLSPVSIFFICSLITLREYTRSIYTTIHVPSPTAIICH